MKTWVLFSMISVAIISGCVAKHRVILSANTEPPTDWVYERDGDNQVSSSYMIEITNEHRQAKKVELPVIIFKARGHLPYEYRGGAINLDQDFWKNNRAVNGFIDHRYHNTRKIYLTEDPAYTGPETPNKVRAEIRSEPSGAKIYADGKFFCQTPCSAIYTIRNTHYNTGVINANTLTAVLHGNSQEKDPQIRIDPAWKYKSGKTFNAKSGILFIMGGSGAYGHSGSGYYNQSSESCIRAKNDYTQAQSAYNRAKSIRDTRRGESQAAGFGALGRGSGAVLSGFLAGAARSDADTAQMDMEHALRQIQDAKYRISQYCND